MVEFKKDFIKDDYVACELENMTEGNKYSVNCGFTVTKKTGKADYLLVVLSNGTKKMNAMIFSNDKLYDFFVPYIGQKDAKGEFYLTAVKNQKFLNANIQNAIIFEEDDKKDEAEDLIAEFAEIDEDGSIKTIVNIDEIPEDAPEEPTEVSEETAAEMPNKEPVQESQEEKAEEKIEETVEEKVEEAKEEVKEEIKEEAREEQIEERPEDTEEETISPTNPQTISTSYIIRRFAEKMQEIEHPFLNKLVRNIYNKPNMRPIFVLPATEKSAFNHKHGIAIQILTALEFVDGVCNNLKSSEFLPLKVNKDLLIAGALLCNIGKAFTIEIVDGKVMKTQRSLLESDLLISRSVVIEEIHKLQAEKKEDGTPMYEISEDMITELVHMIDASTAYGGLSVPRSKHAMLLSNINSLVYTKGLFNRLANSENGKFAKTYEGGKNYFLPKNDD